MAKKSRNKKEKPRGRRFRAKCGVLGVYRRHLAEMRKHLHDARRWEALAQEPDETEYWFRILSRPGRARGVSKILYHAGRDESEGSRVST